MLKCASIMLSAMEWPSGTVKFVFNDWKSRLSDTEMKNEWHLLLDDTDEALKAIMYSKYQNLDKEWYLFAYKLEVIENYDTLINANFSTAIMNLAVMRNTPYYFMTFMVPIFVLTLLAPVGLIIPGTIQYVEANP